MHHLKMTRIVRPLLFSVLSVCVSLILSILIFARYTTNDTISSIPLYVISLERAKQRREHVAKVLSGMNYTIYSAVDGKQMTNEQKAEADYHIKPHLLTPGYRGSFLSHLHVWKQVIDSKQRCAGIFEDDLSIAAPNFPVLLNHLCSIMTDHHILYLGHCHEHPLGSVVDHAYNYTVRESFTPICIHAYLVTDVGAQRLVDYFEMHKAKLGLDIEMEQAAMRGWVKSLSVFPSAVTQAPFKSQNKS